MRLDQFVSKATGLSRKQSHKVIRAGHVTVAGEVHKKAAEHIDPNAAVQLDHETIALPGLIYLMMNKPPGFICATEDARQPTVIDLIDHAHWYTLHPVGRLDIDTTGLLLLSNDGQWTHHITSPRHQLDKVYLAQLAEPLAERAAKQLRDGVTLEGEKQPVHAVDLAILPQQQARITIREGKYHQIKRMFAAVGNHVEALQRERIGDLTLDPELELSEWRPLTAAELALLD